MKKVLSVFFVLVALLAVSCASSANQEDRAENTADTTLTDTSAASETTADTIYISTDSALTEPVAADIVVNINDLSRTIEFWGNDKSAPMSDFRLEVSGLEYPIILHISDYNYVSAVEAFGYVHPTKTKHQLYGNCHYDVFSAEGAVVFQSGSYDIGSSYIITPKGCSELHTEEVASPQLYVKDGDLRYMRTTNNISGISQTGPLGYATSYDDIYREYGDAWIDGGHIVLGTADEIITLDDAYDLDKLFSEREDFSLKYATIEDLFEANRKRLETLGY